MLKKYFLSLCCLVCLGGMVPVTLAATTGAEIVSTSTVPIDHEILSGTASTEKTSNASEGTYESAIIRNLDTETETTSVGNQQKQQYVIEYLSGPLQGQTRTLSNEIESNPYKLNPHIGDRVIIFLQPNPEGGEAIAFLESFDRRVAIFWLIALFILTMVLLAGWQGIKVAFSIFLSIALIGWILIPSFIHGLNPVPIAIALSTLLVTLSSVFATGWNRKTWVTVVGTFGGVIVAYIVSIVFTHWTHLNGLSTEEDRLFFDKNPGLNPQGLLFAGIIIAAMGVVEDVAVSIASGVLEVHHANPRLGFKELFRSGMIVGRDHMSALANTLIYAYVGASLSTLLLYSQYGGSWLKFLNFDSVVDEIVRSLSGTIGLIFTVPITALLAALWSLKPEPRAEMQTRFRQRHGHEHL